jgi:hypothetical protein
MDLSDLPLLESSRVFGDGPRSAGPTGTITFPPHGACLSSLVILEDDLVDLCDAFLERCYAPGPRPFSITRASTM